MRLRDAAAPWLEPRTPERRRRRKAQAAKLYRHLDAYGRLLTSPEDIVKYSKDRYRHARALGYRSGLEVRLCRQLDNAGVKYAYEPFKIPYIVPESAHKYLPDVVLSTGIVLEFKGVWTTDERKKTRLLVEQYADLDLRVVFGNAHATIGKKSKTTYAMYCDRLGIKWAHRDIPQEWLGEKPNKKSLAVINLLRSDQE